MTTEQQVLAGTTEIAEHFNVTINTVCNWRARHDDFPEPALRLRMGMAWDLNEVVDWYNRRWAPGEEE